MHKCARCNGILGIKNAKVYNGSLLGATCYEEFLKRLELRSKNSLGIGVCKYCGVTITVTEFCSTCCIHCKQFNFSTCSIFARERPADFFKEV